jgi:hypothetical protein
VNIGFSGLFWFASVLDAYGLAAILLAAILEKLMEKFLPMRINRTEQGDARPSDQRKIEELAGN